MTPITKASLTEQRQALRQKLLEQRLLIARQLDPAPKITNRYPRSMTMRFLTRRPALAAKVLAECAALAVSARLFGPLNTAWTLTRIIRSISSTKQTKLPVPKKSDN
jgi:hypothetical protein